jgi:TPR repeat protein
MEYCAAEDLQGAREANAQGIHTGLADAGPDDNTVPMNQIYVLPDKDLSRLEDLAFNGDLRAVQRVYDHYSLGVRQERRSQFWLKKGAEMGDTAMQQLYADTLISTATNAKDKNNALKWFRKAVAGGSASAARSLSDIYQHGLFGISADARTSSCWAGIEETLSQGKRPPELNCRQP